MQFPRKFQVWSYSVSHSQLLLRSNKTEELGTRVEVLFKGVGAIKLPTVIHGLEISELPAGQALALLDTLLTDDDIVGRRLYMVRSGKSIGFVVAVAVFYVEDDGEYFTPSSLYDPGGI